MQDQGNEQRDRTIIPFGSSEKTIRPRAPMIVQVAKQCGVSPFKQLRESIGLRYGPRKLSSNEYYDFGLYDPDMPADVKRQFAGVDGIKILTGR